MRYRRACCVPGEFSRIVSQDVPRELYAQHFTRNPLTASLMFRVLLDIHCPNTFLLAFLFQIPSVISSVQLKRNSRWVGGGTLDGWSHQTDELEDTPTLTIRDHLGPRVMRANSEGEHLEHVVASSQTVFARKSQCVRESARRQRVSYLGDASEHFLQVQEGNGYPSEEQEA